MTEVTHLEPVVEHEDVLGWLRGHGEVSAATIADHFRFDLLHARRVLGDLRDQGMVTARVVSNANGEMSTMLWAAVRFDAQDGAA